MRRTREQDHLENLKQVYRNKLQIDKQTSEEKEVSLERENQKLRESHYKYIEEAVRRIANNILTYPFKNIPRDKIKDYFDDYFKQLSSLQVSDDDKTSSTLTGVEPFSSDCKKDKEEEE